MAYPVPGDKNVIAPPSTKIAKFEAKSRRKSVEEAKSITFAIEQDV